MLNLVQLHFLMLTWLVYNNIVVLITKRYHGCKCCGPSINDTWSKHLGKPVYDYSRVFFLEDHPYRRVASAFNGKPEITQRPKIKTSTDWIRAYDIEKEKEYSEMFDSNVGLMIDGPGFFDTYKEKMPTGMKIKYIFYELPYWAS
jgi:hypothetical protein